MKVLVLFSGGVDSTTALALAIQEHGKDNVVALSISYSLIVIAHYYNIQIMRFPTNRTMSN